MTDRGSRTAYVDESLRTGSRSLCVVTATAIDNSHADQVRRAMRSILRPGQPRFHWRDETEIQRTKMLEAIASTGSTTVAYVCRAPGVRQDRARAKCVVRMLWDLGQFGIQRVVFESRGRRNDDKDARTIGQAKRTGSASTDLVYDFGRPHAEPLLWIPDALAGATAAHVTAEQSGYFRSLPDGLVSVIEVDP